MPGNSERIVIAIDGLAATGKSSLAKGVAQRLQYTHLNTGLLYRSIAQALIQNNLNTSENFIKETFLPSLSVVLDKSSDTQEARVSLVGKFPQCAITHTFTADQVQSEATSALASQVAVLPSVREFLLPVQREAFKGLPIVAEGRDTGTVIFPNAKVKIFVEVPSKVRAQRRLMQLDSAYTTLSKEVFEERLHHIEQEILERDHRDQTRANAPCIPAQDAKVYQNTRPSLEEAVDELCKMISTKL